MRESSVDGVYVAGDCKAGPSTVVSAIADAKAVAVGILMKLGLPHDFVRMAATSESSRKRDSVCSYVRSNAATASRMSDSAESVI